MAGAWALPVQILYRSRFTCRTGSAPLEIVFATLTSTCRHPVRPRLLRQRPRVTLQVVRILLMNTYEMNVSLLIQIAGLGAIALLGFCVAPGFAATISRSGNRGVARGDLVDDRIIGCRQKLARAAPYPRNLSNLRAAVTARKAAHHDHSRHRFLQRCGAACCDHAVVWRARLCVGFLLALVVATHSPYSCTAIL
jgi:hypothetical protein